MCPHRDRSRAVRRARRVVLAGVTCIAVPGCSLLTSSEEKLDLAKLYVLTSIDGQPLPVVVENGATRRVRMLADTLYFSPGEITASGQYFEDQRLAASDGASPEAVQHITTTRDVYRRDMGSNDVILPTFYGGRATGKIVPGPGRGTLHMKDARGRTWSFDAP